MADLDLKILLKNKLIFVSNIIEKYKLVYAEDAVHEEAFEAMAELTKKFPNALITGDDLTVTNKDLLKKQLNTSLAMQQF